MNKREMFAWGIAGLSCVCAIASFLSHRRTARLLKKSVEELAKATPVEIEKEVVDAVVQEALEMKVDSQVDDILEETRKDIDKHIRSTVMTVAMAEISRCHDQVAKEYSDRIAHLNEDEVKEMVKNKASVIIERKLEGQFDDILKQYQRRLDEINSMYTRVISKAPNLNMVSNVNPGLHLQW